MASSQNGRGRNAVTIARTEFEEYLPDVAEEVDVANTSERVYELPLPSDDLSVRVFSTIEGESTRGYGEDAIRTVVWSETAEGPVGGETKTLRIETWADNLRDKISSVYDCWRQYDHGTCPECGEGVLCERSGKYGDFLACSTWNGGAGCEYTEDL